MKLKVAFCLKTFWPVRIYEGDTFKIENFSTKKTVTKPGLYCIAFITPDDIKVYESRLISLAYWIYGWCRDGKPHNIQYYV